MVYRNSLENCLTVMVTGVRIPKPPQILNKLKTTNMRLLRFSLKQILGFFVIFSIYVLIKKIEPLFGSWWLFLVEALFFSYCSVDFIIKRNEINNEI